jgi:ferredoxin-NADP reductase
MSLFRKLRCTVAAIADHGGRVYTVDLSPEKPLPAFRAGQFLHLTVDDYDPASFWPDSRVFSIASSPRERQRLRICYAVKGRYTARMEAALKVGAEVWIKLPYGEFVIDASSDAVLLAGGTGISAFTAFVEALAPENPRPVWLAYGARSPELLLFRDMILAQLGRVPAFHVLFFTENPAPEFAAEMAALPRPAICLEGRISLDQAFAHVPDAAAKVFYLSGPPVMLKALGAGLGARGVPPDRIRTDAWE